MHKIRLLTKTEIVWKNLPCLADVSGAVGAGFGLASHFRHLPVHPLFLAVLVSLLLIGVGVIQVLVNESGKTWSCSCGKGIELLTEKEEIALRVHLA